jgi:chitinase
LAFIEELRAANPSLILTAAAGIRPWLDATGQPSMDVSQFVKALDWIAIMNYGMWLRTYV